MESSIIAGNRVERQSKNCRERPGRYIWYHTTVLWHLHEETHAKRSTTKGTAAEQRGSLSLFFLFHLHDPGGLFAVAVPGSALYQVTPDVLHHLGHVHHVPRILRIGSRDLRKTKLKPLGTTTARQNIGEKRTKSLRRSGTHRP